MKNGGIENETFVNMKTSEEISIQQTVDEIEIKRRPSKAKKWDEFWWWQNIR